MENIVSTFLVRTCRMHTKFFVNERLLHSPLLGSRSLRRDCTENVCGSQAEFYIQPTISCVDDLDLHCTSNDFLAFDTSCEIPEGAGSLRDVVICWKLESYEQNRSFVRMLDPVIGIYDWSVEAYRFEDIQSDLANLMAVLEKQFDLSPMYLLKVRERATRRSTITGELTELTEIPWELFET